ncbi:MAG: acyl-CoA dehydrogenase family protein [Acidimicrobiales bacterium]
MDFTPSARVVEQSERVNAFMDEHVYPNEHVVHQQVEADRWAQPAIIEELKVKAHEAGLWNLFLPDAEYGAGLSNLEYAPLAEIMGRSLHLAPESMNCSAPDTGNMEVFHDFGTDEQKDRWLVPLLAGEIRSCFAMTEPDVASSDAANISTTITREGDEYVINGRKWWTSGAMHPHCAVMILMGKTNPDAARHQQQSQIAVPMDAPGITVVRPLTVFGYDDAPHGHAEVVLEDVRVPVENVIGEEGGGFAIAQARLGPGRIHHCMRLIGMAERALEMMCRRAHERSTFGSTLAEKGVVQEWIADSRIEIEQARLLVLKTAWLMDTVGNRGAATEISAIKVAVPNMALQVIDRSIQTHGGGGISQDFPLAGMWAQARTLRFADGPDEVHRRQLARRELRAYAPQ